MIRKRVTKHFDEALGGYQPSLVIRAEGIDDVYRLARHLERGQVEFGVMGRAILRSMDEQSPGVVRYLTERMGPSRGGYRGRKRRRPPQLRLGLTEAELDELEVSVRG